MEKLLARIKGLFSPDRASAPPSEAEVAARPLVSTREVAELRAPEPIATLAAPPRAEDAAAIAEEAPAISEAAATPVEETPLPMDEVASPIHGAPVPMDESPSEDSPSAEAPTDLDPAADGLTLRLETERGSKSTFQVTKSGATIGRGPESTIQLADLSVSRKHARIAYRQGSYWLSDLGSMGGTWVDGAKLAAPRRVATGQTIDIGLCRLVVVAAVEGEKTGAAKGPSSAA